MAIDHDYDPSQFEELTLSLKPGDLILITRDNEVVAHVIPETNHYPADGAQNVFALLRKGKPAQ